MRNLTDEQIEAKYVISQETGSGCDNCILYTKDKGVSLCNTSEQDYCVDNGVVFKALKGEVKDMSTPKLKSVREQVSGECDGCYFNKDYTTDGDGETCNCNSSQMTSDCTDRGVIYVVKENIRPVSVPAAPNKVTPQPKTNKGFLSVDIGEEVLIKERVGGSMQYNEGDNGSNSRMKNWKQICLFYDIHLTNGMPVPVPDKKYIVTHKFFYPNSLNDVYIIQEILTGDTTPRNYLMNDQGIKKIQRVATFTAWDLVLTCPYCTGTAHYEQSEISETAHESECPSCGEKSSLPDGLDLSPAFL